MRGAVATTTAIVLTTAIIWLIPAVYLNAVSLYVAITALTYVKVKP